jgi:hypothetical protein
MTKLNFVSNNQSGGSSAMTKTEALAAIEELQGLIFADIGGPALRDLARASADRARAEEICERLATAPGPAGLLREKLGPIRSSVRAFFEARQGVEAHAMLHDLGSLKMIVSRAPDDAS